MSDRSNIEWTDASWNPIRALDLETGKVGSHCEHATTGCKFCYAEGMNKRLGTGLSFKPGHRKHLNIFLDQHTLTAPLRWKKSRMVFVCSMTDIFADFVTDEMLDKIFAIMALCPQHTFQVLTKRAERMRDYLCDPSFGMRVGGELMKAARGNMGAECLVIDVTHRLTVLKRQLPNIWLGVSTERQQEADERILLLLQTPAAIRFVSAEPLLGSVDLTNAMVWTASTNHEDYLDWVIVGGESGPHARVNWVPDVRALVKQCAENNVACFVKQLGSNIQDRNDAGFEGLTPAEWPAGFDEGNLIHNPNGCLEEWQGAPVRVRLKDRKGGDPSEWPEDLRVREFPSVKERAFAA